MHGKEITPFGNKLPQKSQIFESGETFSSRSGDMTSNHKVSITRLEFFTEQLLQAAASSTRICHHKRYPIFNDGQSKNALNALQEIWDGTWLSLTLPTRQPIASIFKTLSTTSHSTYSYAIESHNCHTISYNMFEKFSSTLEKFNVPTSYPYI